MLDAERSHELYESHDHVLYFSCIVLMGVFKNSTDFIVCLKMEICHEMIICLARDECCTIWQWNGLADLFVVNLIVCYKPAAILRTLSACFGWIVNKFVSVVWFFSHSRSASISSPIVSLSFLQLFTHFFGHVYYA